MLYSFSFNSIKKSYVICEVGKRRSAFAPIRRNFVTLPGLPGAHLESTDTEVRIIQQPIVINGKDRLDVRKLEEDLADWLITKDPVKLIFDDEPNRVYFAVIDGSLNIEDIARFGKGVITFICPDPYKYGSELTFTSHASLEEVNTLVMNNPGTRESYPVFTMIAKKPITHLDIIGPDGYMRIGRPVSVEETVINPRESILNDTMSTLVGWTTAHNVDGGVRTGSFQASSKGFSVSDYGTGSSWHGPSLQKSLSQQLDNFEVEMFLTLQSLRNTEVGRVELYLLDENGQHIGKVAMKDILTGDYLNQVEARVGPLVSGTYIATGTPPRPSDWIPFKGIIRITRIEGKWNVYIANIGSRHIGPLHGSYLESGDLKKLAAIQVHIGVSKDRLPSKMQIHNVKVFKRNVITEDIVPYIAHEGDEIIIDHRNDSILVNGEEMQKLKGDFMASFFPIQSGDTALVISPGDAVDIEGRVRGAYH